MTFSADERLRLQPSPDLTPEQVVQIQMDALQENDIPHEDAGIALAFAFASPANRAVTGPLPRFAQMVKNPLYRDMLGCQRVVYGPLRVEGGRAEQMVTVLSERYAKATYLFALSRQRQEPYAGCWMTDSVVRVEEDVQ